MDTTSLAIAVAIAAYGVVEYRRREALHARHISEIRRGLRPLIDLPHVAFWQVCTTGAVGILLIAFVAILLALEFRTGVKAGPYVPVAAFFGLLFLIVALMFMRVLVGYIWWRNRR
jgi:hydrogenase-4 membrane subunit HyfE